MEALLLSTLLPAGVDLIKNLFGSLGRKFIGLSVDDQLKLDDAQLKRLEALAKLENPYGSPAQWVVDLRASYRYIAATILVFCGLVLAGYGAYTVQPEIISTGLETASMPFGFIFGERMYLGIKGSPK